MATPTAPTTKLLVQLKPGAEPGQAFGLAAADRTEQLLPPRKDQGLSFGLAEDSGAWYLSDVESATIGDAWEAAYAHVRSNPAVAYAEPDVVHGYIGPESAPFIDGAFAARGACEFNDQLGAPIAQGPGFGWHLKDQFSGLKAAREQVGMNPGFRARIAHIDTGFDPDHPTRPDQLLRALGRNFSETGDPGSAIDPSAGEFTGDNSGHGTGTLSILAGTRFKFKDEFDDFLGGAPQAEVIPIRIAGSVVLLRTAGLVKALQYAIDQGCHVASMSMGGLPSKAWAEAVNRAYEAGICFVAAAGNNVKKFGITSPQSVVYPARFDRVIAACGVMADGQPYIRDRVGDFMAGNFGPDRKMRTAIAAFTPNIPWAEFHCSGIVDMDGQGTSAATPQVAAAAALWLMRHNPKYDEPWKRVEAVRFALFSSAQKVQSNLEQYLGQGILRARAALDVSPPSVLRKTAEDSVLFPFLRIITGLGLSEVTADGRTRTMVETELQQIWQRDSVSQEILPDPEAELAGTGGVQRFLLRVIDDPSVGASRTLREYLKNKGIQTTVRGGTPPNAIAGPPMVSAISPQLVQRYDPPARRLTVYAFDPSLSTRTDTLNINEITVSIPWEDNLKEGPCGEYLEVIDHDPASGCFYEPINLNHPHLLAQDGVPPSEGNPHFHQQMVYAVAMRTIKFFESALGRPAFWAHRQFGDLSEEQQKLKAKDILEVQYVPRLRLYPHALRQANAFYSPNVVGILFGYFVDEGSDRGEELPGGIVFTCLSHDVIAHETTHALLDGMHPRLRLRTNRDTAALHEGFADIVALFQHFSLPDVLKSQIAKTRGDLEKQNLLGDLARQVGRAMGKRGALRSAINQPADPKALDTTDEPHKRGAILVAAVFDAFMDVYRRRIADLLRISTGGTGRLPDGEIHPDLVNRLANEAASTARYVLNMCIRALDYCPPVDVTFGDYLRAIITADFELVRNDAFNYRVSFVDAFRRRGIYPDGVRTLSVETLLWGQMPSVEALPAKISGHFIAIFEALREFASQSVYWHSNRKTLFVETSQLQGKLHEMIAGLLRKDPDFAPELGIDSSIVKANGEIKFEVHSVRRAERIGPDGVSKPQVIIVLTQSREVDGMKFYGGSTFVVDLRLQRISYRIMKNINSARRAEAAGRFRADDAENSLRETYFSEAGSGEPFAILHGDQY